MKKVPRIFALAGAVLLVVLYICTLIFALLDAPVFQNYLKASIAATILLPILLYSYMLIYRILKHDDDRQDKE